MQSEEKKLLDEFESKKWLYLYNELSREEKEHWDQKLKSHPSLINERTPS